MNSTKLLNHTSSWVFCCKFSVYFQNHFLQGLGLYHITCDIYRVSYNDLSVYYTKLIIPNINYHLIQKTCILTLQMSDSSSLYSPSALYPYSRQKPLFRSQLLKFRAGECLKNELLDKLSCFLFFIVYWSLYFQVHLILADLVNKYSKWLQRDSNPQPLSS